MCSSANPRIRYRNRRLLQLAFLQLHRQQQRGALCDVLLRAEGEAVPAHGCVLSACSPLLAERLERERPAQGCPAVLELGGLQGATLRKLVDFLYSSEIEAAPEEARDVLAAARQLRVCELEYLQLWGGRLVRAPQGRGRNRARSQPPAAAPVSGRCPRTVPPVTQTRRPPGKSSGKDEGPRDSSRERNAEDLPGAPLRKKKAGARPARQEERASSATHSQESKENRSDAAPGPIELSSPSVGYPFVGKWLLPIKIRLSRSKPSADSCPSEPSSSVSGRSSGPADPGRRLRRQKNTNEAPKDKHKPRRAHPLQSTPSPSSLGKSGGSKKWNSEVRAPDPDSANEGKIGKIKLRRTFGTHWEIVQEPPLKTSQDSPHVLEPRDSEEPAGTRPSSVNQQEILSTRIDQCQDSPVCSGLQDILFSGSLSPDHPVVKSKFGSSPEVLVKEPGFDIHCGEPHAFDTALLGPTCETEKYRITSVAATSELGEIREFRACGLDIEPPIGSLESPRAKDCRTPSYHLTETGKNCIKKEEWYYLPDIEFLSRECIGLEKEPVGENKESVEPFIPLVKPSKINEGQVLSVGCSLIQDQGITSSQLLNGQRDKLLHNDFLDSSQMSYGDLSPPCSNWTTEEVLYPDPEPGKEVFSNSELLDPFPASLEEEEIDVVDWTLEGRLVSTCIPSVWPDPSSESETEVDILT